MTAKRVTDEMSPEVLAQRLNWKIDETIADIGRLRAGTAEVLSKLNQTDDKQSEQIRIINQNFAVMNQKVEDLTMDLRALRESSNGSAMSRAQRDMQIAAMQNALDNLKSQMEKVSAKGDRNDILIALAAAVIGILTRFVGQP